MKCRFVALASFVALTVCACGGPKEGPPLPESARAITYQAPRRGGTSVMTVLADGTVQIGRRELAPNAIDGLESNLTAIATATGSQVPPAGTPTELAISDSVLRIQVVADAPLAVVTPVVEHVLRTLCETWPGSARIHFDVATPSIRAPRIFPVLVRSIAGKPGKSADKYYVALRVKSVAALPAGHDPAKPWTLTITPNAGGAPEVAAQLGWDEVKQRVAGTKVASELVIDVDVLGTTKWSDVMKLLDQAAEVHLDEVSLR